MSSWKKDSDNWSSIHGATASLVKRGIGVFSLGHTVSGDSYSEIPTHVAADLLRQLGWTVLAPTLDCRCTETHMTTLVNDTPCCSRCGQAV